MCATRRASDPTSRGSFVPLPALPRFPVARVGSISGNGSLPAEPHKLTHARGASAPCLSGRHPARAAFHTCNSSESRRIGAGMALGLTPTSVLAASPAPTGSAMKLLLLAVCLMVLGGANAGRTMLADVSARRRRSRRRFCGCPPSRAHARLALPSTAFRTALRSTTSKLLDLTPARAPLALCELCSPPRRRPPRAAGRPSSPWRTRR